MATARLQSIDFLRGLVMVLMTIDHAREFFYFAMPLPDPMEVEQVDVGTFFSRWLAHFCAPVFVFLTGLSAWLLADRRQLSRRELAWFLFQRGALFVVLEVTVINFAWTFAFPPEKIFLQVIWAIGVSMICLSGLIWLPWYLQLLTAVSIVAGHNLLDSVELQPGTAINWVWAILHDRQTLTLEGISIRTSYPVLPWIGLMAVGYVSGRWFEFVQQGTRLVWLGLAVFAAFVGMRVWGGYGEPHAWRLYEGQYLLGFLDFFNLTKYPPSLLFIMMTLGPAMVVLWGASLTADLRQRLGVRVYQAIVMFGQVPFLFYVLHLYFLHVAYRVSGLFLGYAWNGQPLHTDMPEKLDVGSIWVVWLIALLTLVALYPVVAVFARMKREQRFAVLRYF